MGKCNTAKKISKVPILFSCHHKISIKSLLTNSIENKQYLPFVTIYQLVTYVTIK